MAEEAGAGAQVLRCQCRSLVVAEEGAGPSCQWAPSGARAAAGEAAAPTGSWTSEAAAEEGEAEGPAQMPVPSRAGEPEEAAAVEAESMQECLPRALAEAVAVA